MDAGVNRNLGIRGDEKAISLQGSVRQPCLDGLAQTDDQCRGTVGHFEGTRQFSQKKRALFPGVHISGWFYQSGIHQLVIAVCIGVFLFNHTVIIFLDCFLILCQCRKPRGNNDYRCRFYVTMACVQMIAAILFVFKENSRMLSVSLCCSFVAVAADDRFVQFHRILLFYNVNRSLSFLAKNP